MAIQNLKIKIKCEKNKIIVFDANKKHRAVESNRYRYKNGNKS